ncbi:PAS domain S-box protein [Mucilaginibacter achroorhodeus]|uniref:histidine kinase n=1 Tax=Mucilaginibacter achroorhodeus TaxID=2599294 RepID=A0A563U703_9SPHI|nr:PAS domain-containing protein [Mucilaginibacter achroorhodeus]TWR27126.1 PAS domain S-box protein [Mucilaginibacter achroorhodeus]
MDTDTTRLSSEELLEIISLANKAIAVYTGKDIIIETATDAMLRFWDVGREVIGKPLEEAVPILKDQEFINILRNVWRTGQTYMGEETPAFLTRDGKLQQFYYDFEYRAVLNPDGSTRCILHTAKDVTEQVLAHQRESNLQTELKAINEELISTNEELAAANEELAASNEEMAASNEELLSTNEELNEANYNLGESESRFRNMITQAPVAIAMFTGANLVIEAANERVLNIWGRTDDIIGMPIADALPELQGQDFLQLLNDTFNTGKEYYGSEAVTNTMHDGQLYHGYYDFIYHPLKNSDGVVYAILMIATEVTEQVNSRKRLQESKNRLASMVMTAPVAMTVLKGRDLVVELANQHMFEIWGRTPGQVINKKLLDVFPELIGQPFPDMLKGVFDTGKKFALPEISVDVSTAMGMVNYIVDFSYDPLFDMEGNVEAIMATVMDITERVSSRRELQQARDTLKLAIESADIGTWSADLETGKLTFSDQALRLQSIPVDANITLDESYRLILPEYVIPVQDSIQRSIDTHESFEVEYRITPMDGSSPRWLRSTGQAYYNDSGKALSIAGTMLDITESKAHDQQKDDFISIASHELKTPVTSLKAALQLLDRMKDNPSPGMMARLIEQSNRSMDKISSLIEDLLNLSRMNEGQLQLSKTTFDIVKLIDDCCSHVRATGKHVILQTGENYLEVFADEHRIDQVVVNLVNNAVKYAPNSKEITLNVDKTDGRVKVSVVDNGPGIPADKQARLFDRYYQTDPSGYNNSGLGLGLFISAEIIKKHHGQIGVNSSLGKGSTFWFTLPIK